MGHHPPIDAQSIIAVSPEVRPPTESSLPAIDARFISEGNAEATLVIHAPIAMAPDNEAPVAPSFATPVAPSNEAAVAMAPEMNDQGIQ